MIRFQLETFVESLQEAQAQEAKDGKLRGGKTLLYDKLPCFSLKSHKFYKTARQINLPH